MAKPELGTKRVCSNCSAKYYDLHRSPIVCPKCGTVFEERVAPVRAVRPEPVAAPAARPVVEDAVEIEDAEVVPVEDDAELVPLEDVEEEEEAGAGKGVPVEDEDEEMTEFTKEIVEDEFIEDEEEDDVVGLIEGEVEADEEER